MNALKLKTFLPLLFLFTIFSCQKEKNTLLTVYTVDSSGDGVSGVNVLIYPNQEINEKFKLALSKEQESTVSGEAIFDYTQFFENYEKGFILLKVDGIKDGKTATGWIDLREGKASEARLYFN